ncbi:MAG: O-antigen ligase family protein [Acidobacteria bacterium]|nr:O-antigen ligase family protein [Acidobacteriota bacterium]
MPSNPGKVTGVILCVGAAASVLAFGGVEIVAFAPVQIAVALLAAFVFWRYGSPGVSTPTLVVLIILLAIPLLQMIPLPHSAVAAAVPARVALADSLRGVLGAAPLQLPLSVNTYETQLALTRLVCYLLVFLLSFQSYRSSGEAFPLITFLLVLGAIEAIYGTVQYLAGWHYIFTYAKKAYLDDATGTYINHNHFAGFLELVLPFALARILFSRSPGQRKWSDVITSTGSSQFLTGIVVFAILGVALIFSRSRMGIVGASAGLLVVSILALLQPRRRSTLAILLFLVAVPVAYGFWIGLSPVVERFDPPVTAAPIEEDRLPIWRDAVRLIRDYPLLGTGLGTYRWANLHYQSTSLWGRFEHAHSDYLEFPADIGIPAALLLFLSLWILTVRTAIRAHRAEHSNTRTLAAGCAGAMTAMLFHSITDFNLQIPANAFIFSWIAGTAAALVARNGMTTAKPRLHLVQTEKL